MTIVPRLCGVLIAVFAFAPALAAPSPVPPAAIWRDPPIDEAHPAANISLQFESHGAKINAVVLRPPGAGAHPTVLLSHGLPGNEQNLDLAQSLRRAGWTVVTYHYRGSWGSGGTYSLKNGMEDARAILAAVREPERAKALGVDPAHIVLVGHSYGGLVSAHVAASDPGLEGVVLIAPWDPEVDARELAPLDPAKREAWLEAGMDDVPGRLGPVGPREIGEEIMRDRASLSMAPLAPRLATRPILILTADHDSENDKARDLIEAIAAQPHRLTVVNNFTDHAFADHRIALQEEVLTWIAKLPGAPRPAPRKARPHRN